jgi:predicted metalloprotease with PDZ domain
MIVYHLAYQAPLTGYIPVETTFDPLGAATVAVQLAAWRPGRYELQNFAQKLRHLRAFDEQGRELSFRKTTKDRWEIETAGVKTLAIRYDFYARQLDAGGSWVDEQQLYVNPVNCCLAVVGREHEPCELTLGVPEGWRVACALPTPSRDARVLHANGGYDELADSPLIASPTLQHEAYEIGGHRFHVWVQGTPVRHWERLLADFRAFSEEQLRIFGGFPRPSFDFLVQVLPTKFYHGVEHTASTVLALGPAELLGTPALYKELLGVACHELFHVWNVKLIRPVEMQPYDFTRENFFRTGYVAEGLTTYYGDYLLCRAGVFTPEQYFAELNGVLRKHFDEDGWRHLSVADSSMDLWLDGYKGGVPGRKVSIYHKGCLAALLLDLELRRLSDGLRSLDDVMRALWTDFGQTGTGYSEADYREVVEAVAGEPLDWYFNEVIEGLSPLEKLLDRALGTVGCQLLVEESASPAENMFGFRVNAQAIAPDVVAIAENSPAARSLSLDDEIVAINGRKVENNLHVLLHGLSEVELTVFRQKHLRTIKLVAGTDRFFRKFTVDLDPDASPGEVARRALWLGHA